jgi:hypothetical protein
MCIFLTEHHAMKVYFNCEMKALEFILADIITKQHLIFSEYKHPVPLSKKTRT